VLISSNFLHPAKYMTLLASIVSSFIFLLRAKGEIQRLLYKMFL